MPRFYFHLYNDADVSDQGGKDLADLDSARTYAIEMVRFEVAEGVKRDGRINLSHRLDIENESHDVLATVRFGDAVQVTP